MPTVTKQNGDTLLDPEFLNRIEQLEIISRKIFRGTMRGERRSKRRGESVEFADHRSYVPGDDLRFLDWNIMARLDRLFLKLFLEEEDLHLSLLLDVSRSMDWGDPGKALYIRRVAAALAYIGLCNFDRVSLYGFSDGLTSQLAGVRGRRRVSHVMDYLTNLECEGGSNLAEACKQFAIRHPQPGIVLVLSDFFDKGGFEQGFQYLLGRNFDLYAMQVLSPQEIEPELTGDLQLRDVEDDDLAEVTVSRALINRYKRNLEAFCGSVKDYCTRRGINYLFTGTDTPFDQIILSYLRRRGLLR
ncbi:MAG: DUF58 domain-containing protein [bacterium]|nr:DUF58 domain-containing protein [bacterium]